MQLNHSFTLPLALEEAWDTLLKVDEIAPCIPGATAQKSGPASYDIAMRVRLGPLDLLFKGRIELVDVDKEHARFVCKAKVQESRGQGSANGSTNVRMSEIPEGVRVDLDTELLISGRVAQMGRGFVGEVSNDLLAQFALNLENRLTAQARASSADATARGGEVAGQASPNSGAWASPASSQHLAAEPPRLNLLSMIWKVLRRRLASAWGGK